MSENIYLALNAAEKNIQFVIGNEQELLYGQDYSGQKNGTDSLFHFLKQALGHLKIPVSAITHLASVAGPGNFMGIRITALIASSLARMELNTAQSRKWQAEINYLDCLANNLSLKDNSTVKVLTSATKHSLHCADYRFNHGVAEKITQLYLLPIKNLGQENLSLNEGIEPDYIVGSGLVSLEDSIAKAYPRSTLLPKKFNNLSLETLYQQALSANYGQNDIVPIYLKKCDALENLDSIAQKQGHNPKDAHAHLEKLMNSKDF